MDWYAWLSKAGLTPAATYEYGLTFSENKLEPTDAPDFDHDLLKSMGVAVAKHRFDILKLARKHAAAALQSSSSSSMIAARLARKAGRYVARSARRLARGGGRASTSVSPLCGQCRDFTWPCLLKWTSSGGMEAGGENLKEEEAPEAIVASRTRTPGSTWPSAPPMESWRRLGVLQSILES